ncbi:pyridoxal-phosphate dependent enzyme [Roseibium denhamense]|uniref:Diaminopropionate ammonia-lyase n=1 Tax=Roseibium denhamense TaxID=76305 RepID=A0ABY1P817_9HYPH|nr:pyridoxal-phosphate dependent enzyme [Roseibium denhamense]MTI04466.1 pyridoxal-phosphate dependent enzyme [Roseibium denhamense]SMP28537.1 diaminopropionate ammonia-lyase [Roseibium denhamense]
MQFQNNPWKGTGLPDLTGLADGNVSHEVEQAKTLFAPYKGQDPTPLVDDRTMAAELGLGALYIKDESSRMGLGSFKALGAGYAIAKSASNGTAESGNKADLADITFICASAGNHGLSMASGARRFGANAVVVISETVPEAFAQRLRALGADAVRAGKIYEESMAEAERLAAENGWHLLPDSTWPGMTTPGHDVMEGYLIMGDEVAAQVPEPPTHVFLQAGVGGMAAACAVSARIAWGGAPQIIIVEPDAAPALWASIEAGRLAVGAGPVSNMGRLDCKEPSHLALKYLAREANGFALISDDEASQAVDWLAGHGLKTTPSGGAGIAGVLHAKANKTALGLDSASRVLCYLSEGPEDG